MSPRHARGRFLLTAVLLLQVALAPSLCLARMAPSDLGLVEICTAQGLKLVQMAEDGSDGLPMPEGFCALCHALPEAPAWRVPVLPAPSWLRMEPAWRVAGPAAPPPAIRGPPTGSRAPPHLLS